MNLRLLAASVFASAVFGLSTASAETRLTFSTSESPTSPSSPVFEKWATALTAETDGDVVIEFFYSQALSKLGDNLKAVSRGVADIAVVVPAYSRTQLPLAYLSSTATGTGDQYVVAAAWQTVRDEFPAIKAEEDKNNIVFLVPNSVGSVVFVGDGIYDKPSDLNGGTMRLSSHYAYAAAKAGWPVNPARVLSPETYISLEKGTINAATTYITQIYPHKLNEVAKNVTIINLGQHTSMIYMNKDRWESLSEKARTVIKRSLPQLSLDLAKAEIEASRATLEKLDKDPRYPMNIHRIDSESRKIWAEQLRHSYENNVQKAAAVNPKAPEIAERYLSLIDSIETEVDAKGYPWEK